MRKHDIPGWLWPAGITVVGILAYIVRPRGAGAGAGAGGTSGTAAVTASGSGGSEGGSGKSAPCAEWSGDAKAMQQAISSARKAAGMPGVTADGRPGAMTCRAAEWLVANDHASAEIAAFARSKSCGCGMPRAPCGITGPVASAAVKGAMLDAAVAKGYSRAEVTKAVGQESGWRPSAVACMGADHHPVAGGLLQFIGPTLKARGFHGSPDQFAALTGEEQLPYLLEFLKRMPTSTLHRNGDFHLALFTPAFVSKPADYVIYAKGSLGWQQNPGLRPPGGGDITVGSVLAIA